MNIAGKVYKTQVFGRGETTGLRRIVLCFFLALPVALFGIVAASRFSVLGPVLPRVSLCVFAGLAVLSIVRPMWSVPSFLLIIGPLQTFSITFKINLDRYPITLISSAIWLLAIGVFARARSHAGDVKPWTVRMVVSVLFLLGTAAASLTVGPRGSDEELVTRVVFVTGIVEPLILYLTCRWWLSVYHDRQILIDTLFLSCIVAFVVGFANYLLRPPTEAASEVSSWRYHSIAFGGANLVGVVLVLLYPFCLTHYVRRKNADMLRVALLGAFCWMLAAISLSRGTLIVLSVQTCLMAALVRAKRTMAILLGATAIVLCLIALTLPKGSVDLLVARFRETDLVALVLKQQGDVSASDSYRVETRQWLLSEMTRRPLGGYGATGTVDPENVAIDTAVQLGWLPAACFVTIVGAWLICATRSVTRARYDVWHLCLACSAIGYAMYISFAGANLSKIGIGANDEGIVYNAVATLVTAVILAIYHDHRALAPQRHSSRQAMRFE